jgi:hypothetical protein
VSAPIRITVLSLGAGVQSTVLALMAAEGVLPKPDAMVFADTGWEPRRVYDHLDQLAEVTWAAGIRLHRVSSGNLRDDAINPEHRYASVPYFVQNEPGPCKECNGTGWPNGRCEKEKCRSCDQRACARCRGTGWDDGKGMGRRQCTSEYKLAPINRKVRSMLGATPPDYRRVPKGNHAEQWIGFSSDEIGRVSDKDGVSYITKRYPLIEMGMDRKACVRWLNERGWTSVEKSACIGCPYHGNPQWRDLRDNHPDEWADAVAFDEAIRKGGARGLPLNGEAFLHRSRVPLSIAPIDRVTSTEWRSRQGDLLDVLAEEGEPDGCSPYGCRSGVRVAS